MYLGKETIQWVLYELYFYSDTLGGVCFGGSGVESGKIQNEPLTRKKTGEEEY
jgi:hypothetical protein